MTPRPVTKQPKIAPRRPQDGLKDGFCSYRFLSSSLVGFVIDFGSLWAPFLEPKSVIFGIDFWMIFACRSKIAPRAAKSGPRAAKSLPRASQERPRAAQERPREPQEGPRAAKTDPRGAQEVRKDNEGRATAAGGRKENEKMTRAVQSEAGGRQKSEKITRAVQAKQAAEKRLKR